MNKVLLRRFNISSLRDFYHTHNFFYRYLVPQGLVLDHSFKFAFEFRRNEISVEKKVSDHLKSLRDAIFNHYNKSEHFDYLEKC